ncbi:hypothetical protein DPMN_131998 [Dreissena polymorpha]|uniref:Uncharacterized protein n=1 Tax=Dreissena polymorpha TaxID=45954 RepID=A0A9D4FVY7_DREPO|nr:hypothetical protein DPMN_131998 [Dreissena polymorpha]
MGIIAFLMYGLLYLVFTLHKLANFRGTPNKNILKRRRTQAASMVHVAPAPAFQVSLPAAFQVPALAAVQVPPPYAVKVPPYAEIQVPHSAAQVPPTAEIQVSAAAAV